MMLLVLHGCETWSLTLRKEEGLADRQTDRQTDRQICTEER
jgi:hypothetical protein